MRWSHCALVIAQTLSCIASAHTAVTVINDDSLARKPVQLTADSFKNEIKGVPASSSLLVEFYAHWCPSCQRFQPAYEEVAAYFHSDPKPQPEVWVARIDCAEEPKTCNRYGIKRYPTMKFGQGPDFFSTNETALEEISGGQSAKELVAWLSKRLNTAYDFGSSKSLDVKNSSDASSARRNEADSKASLIDIETATRLAWRYMMDSGDLLGEADARQAFLNFMELLAHSHPLSSCQAGSEAVVKKLPQLWPTSALSGPSPALKEEPVCGSSSEKEEWKQCQGTKPGRRGYTCGLWMLLHSLAAEAEPEESAGVFWMMAVKGFIQHFFQCSLCAEHFVSMTEQPDAEAVRSRRDAVLWMWRAHNQVNKRLQEQEKDGKDGDPAFPKHQWPSSELCPLCHLPSSKADDAKWNEEETYRFLLKYYGKSAITSAEGLSAQQTVKQLFDVGRKSAASTSKIWWLVGLPLVALVMFVCLRAHRGSGSKRRNVL